MRLIDADALKEQFKDRSLEDFTYLHFIDAIEDAPTIEERPKGKWRSVGFENGYAFCICSNCGNTTRLYRDSKNEFCCIADIRNKVIACLYCGAKMDL